MGLVQERQGLQRPFALPGPGDGAHQGAAEQLVVDLQAWCRKAEESGIAALQEFSLKLKAAHA